MINYSLSLLVTHTHIYTYIYIYIIDKKNLYIKKGGDTKNGALRVYRKYTKEAERLKLEEEG